MTQTIQIPFAIGDVVWAPSYDCREAWSTTCLDCAGNGSHIVAMGCGQSFAVPCETCRRTHDYGQSPTGIVDREYPIWRAENLEIDGWQSDNGVIEYKIKYKSGGYRSIPAGECFPPTPEGKAECERICALKTEEAKRSEQATFDRRFASKSDRANGAARTASTYRALIRKTERELARLRELLKEAKP